MARKTRRKPAPRLSQTQLSQVGAGAAAPVAATRATSPVAAPKATRAVVSRIPTDEQLADEYRYVLADLKKIGAIALAMLVFLVILAVVLV